MSDDPAVTVIVSRVDGVRTLDLNIFHDAYRHSCIRVHAHYYYYTAHPASVHSTVNRARPRDRNFAYIHAIFARASLLSLVGLGL